jgi:hypothetical protein
MGMGGMGMGPPMQPQMGGGVHHGMGPMQGGPSPMQMGGPWMGASGTSAISGWGMRNCVHQSVVCHCVDCDTVTHHSSIAVLGLFVFFPVYFHLTIPKRC